MVLRNRSHTQKLARICDEFKNKYYSIMFDSATKYRRAILGTNIQTVQNGKILLRTIGMEQVKTSHTGRNYAEMIKNVLEKYEIDMKKMVAASVDNGSPMIKAVELLDAMASVELTEVSDGSDSDDEDAVDVATYWLDPEFQMDLMKQAAEELRSNYKPILYDMIQCIRCAAHTIQLAINAALQNSNCDSLIENSRTLVKKLRLESISRQLEEAGLCVPSLDVVTRWFSLYTMVIFTFVTIKTSLYKNIFKRQYFNFIFIVGQFASN